VAATCGVPLGLLLGYWAGTGQLAAVPWAGLVQAHGQAQLFGWLGLAVLGVTFHAMAHLFRAEEPPARPALMALGLQLLGVALRLAAPVVPGAAGPAGGWLLLGSAVALLGAFAVTLEAHARTLSRRARVASGGEAPAVLPRYLLAGVLLWLLALLANLDGAVDAVRHGPAAAGAVGATRDAFVVAAATGAFALIAAGMSLRVVVGWLDLPPPDLARASRAWWPLAGAAALRLAAVVATGPASTALHGAAGALWALGVWWYLPALRGLWEPAAARPGGGVSGQADPPLTWFVRSAYAWFAVSGALAGLDAVLTMAGAAGPTLPVPGAAGLADAWRHAVLFGYVATLTAGLTGRLPTVFLDLGDAAVAATRGRYRAAWALLLAAALLRVAAPLAAGPRPVLLVTSGTLGTAGLLCLLGVLWHVVRQARSRQSPARAWQHAHGLVPAEGG
jgi:hypothetical protein